MQQGLEPAQMPPQAIWERRNASAIMASETQQPRAHNLLNRLPAAVLAQLERASQLTCVVEDACECRTG